jgi:hypothetical protein
MKSALALFSLLFLASTTACVSASDGESTGTGEDALHDLVPTSVVGTIAYGQTVTFGAPQGSSRNMLRALSFAGSAGDTIAVTNTTPGRSDLFLVAPDLDTPLGYAQAGGPTPTLPLTFRLRQTGTHYIAVRSRDATNFTVRLDKSAAPLPVSALGDTCDIHALSVSGQCRDGRRRSPFAGPRSARLVWSVPLGPNGVLKDVVVDRQGTVFVANDALNGLAASATRVSRFTAVEASGQIRFSNEQPGFALEASLGLRSDGTVYGMADLTSSNMRFGRYEPTGAFTLLQSISYAGQASIPNLGYARLEVDASDRVVGMGRTGGSELLPGAAAPQKVPVSYATDLPIGDGTTLRVTDTRLVHLNGAGQIDASVTGRFLAFDPARRRVHVLVGAGSSLAHQVFDASLRSEAWKTQPAAKRAPQAVLRADGSVTNISCTASGSATSSVCKVTTHDVSGTVRWSTLLPQTTIPDLISDLELASDSEGRVYVSGRFGGIHGFAPDGARLFSVPTGTDTFRGERLAIGPNRVLYAISGNAVRAFGE